MGTFKKNSFYLWLIGGVRLSANLQSVKRLSVKTTFGEMTWNQQNNPNFPASKLLLLPTREGDKEFFSTSKQKFQVCFSWASKKLTSSVLDIFSSFTQAVVVEKKVMADHQELTGLNPGAESFILLSFILSVVHPSIGSLNSLTEKTDP